MQRGVYPVIQMPLDNDEKIDAIVLAKEIDWLLAEGSAGIVLAMVSEVLRFSHDERRSQWQLTLKLLDGRAPLVASVGAESTAIAVQLAKFAELDGANALMATPPTSFPATEDEIYNYYRSIIDSVKIPVIVQDASNYMGQPLSISLYEKLLIEYGNKRVQFKPEAKPVKDRMQQLQAVANGQALVFEGQSGLDLIDTHPIGLFGTMPGADIIWAIVKLWNFLEAGDHDRARKIHELVAKLVAFQINLDAYVAVEKYLLVKQGIFTSTRQRGPVIFQLDAKAKAEIDQIFEDLKSACA